VRSLVREADWQWMQGRTDWAVQFDESGGDRFRSSAPRFGLAPLGKGVGWGWLVAHVVLVGAFIAGFVDAAVGFDPDDGANIGAGLMLLPLLAQGLPWSLPFIVNPYQFDDSPTALWLVVSIGPALLNVALHAGYRILRWRRIRAAHSTADRPT
jgi:hypothetical protein